MRILPLIACLLTVLGLAVPARAQEATLAAPDSAVAGSTIPVQWTGPGKDSDYISVGRPGEPYLTYAYLVTGGDSVDLPLPPEPGLYEIRYVSQEEQRILATRLVDVTATIADITPPATARAGDTAAFLWSGPDYPDDYIAIAVPGAPDPLAIARTDSGNPVFLPLPGEPGFYEARYVIANGATVLASALFEVTGGGVRLVPPPGLEAGAELSLDWTGPDGPGDRVALTARGGTDPIAAAPTSDGSPARLDLPDSPGAYDLVYLRGSDGAALARLPITLSGSAATLEPPRALPAGATVEIGWTGPARSTDFIAIRIPGDAGGYLTYAYTSQGNPATLQLPARAGNYELVYYTGDTREALATIAVTLTPVAASLDVPREVGAGERIFIDWTGPNYEQDYIAVVERGETAGYITYAYTAHGSPVLLQIPDAPGEYDVVYVTAGSGEVIARAPISAR
ncbi:hypothetical protein [Tropicimonas sp. IMCC6043]|uniref:hypothetical protein n=1 Tax=Tropicimonas sp. IMCC6043 TaxID=2510645 RepID=UPI00101C2F0D|nr:hypothetical protein [Tropicimonas sp. IMCC6043]RYH12371.1 hypothetical protein EU800_02090 [Tropicimonas sp. IMCC6043]